ncbi:MAG TPA: sulfatase-like hydrolase/transferase [Lacipirellulaceae bacterium]|nr:sulfatase-like hydrolase/transferase [Lacipirellulaceae bacterium]
MRLPLWCLCAAALACAVAFARPACAQATKPNIIHIFADDLGFGSVGFEGQTQIKTPNLDALAAGGMTFTNAYAASVCAASRATLYTGFNSGHANVDGNSELTQGFRSDEVMTGTVMEQGGYNTAVFGKWGFGADGVRSLTTTDPQPSINSASSLPTNHGFQTFYGLLNHGAAQDYFYSWMWKNDSSSPNGVSLVPNNGGPGGTPVYSHDLIAAQSEQYITAHAGDSQPFYMQVNYTIPHFDIDQISEVPGGLGQYANLPWTDQEKEYAAMITRMDSSVGSLMAKLDDPNGDGNHSDSILKNTLVIFTSDNGASTEDGAPRDFFDANGPYRGGKFDLYEGGIHMPQVAYWQGTIAPGSTSSYRTDLPDFMATAADLAGVDPPVGIDGTSLAPILTGQGHLKQRNYLVFEHQGSRLDPNTPIGIWSVVRQDGMKLIRFDDATEELFNVNSDPGEQSPLNLATSANLQIAQELEADAIADDVTRGSVQYKTWSGPNGGDLAAQANWGSNAPPDRYWSATVANTGTTPAIAHVASDVTTLGVEVKGQSALQVVQVHSGKTLTGLNEVRVGAHGRIDVDGGTVTSSRWTNIEAGGQITGHGVIKGDVYNAGAIAPGKAAGDPAWPIAAPPALPPTTLSTGVLTAMSFNMSGVQDDVPVSATSTQSQYLQLAHGLDFGPNVGPRWTGGGTDAGNELNTIGYTASSLADAITNGEYVTFTVNPVDGAGIVPSSVSFNLWRNGGAAATNYAILSSVGGFTSSAALIQANYTDSSISHQHALTASIPTVADAISSPVEYRLYAWGATDPRGNTHINAASLSAKFVSVNSLDFNFAGVQDGAPLTATKRQSSNITVTQGLSFGSGTRARGANNVGNEFNVAGFSTSTSLQSAIDGNNYLTFSVQPVAGMAMYPDSVSFSLWRQNTNSATDYAILSSIAGFGSSQQVAQTHLTTTGAANTFALGGPFISSQPTTSAVEYRLYGWNAATSLDDTHVVAASMRARFASVPGASINPTGNLTVQGDFYHLAGGQLAIDLGGTNAGVDYDTLSVQGKADLEGDLAVSLVNAGAFTPALGNTFSILTATGGVTGQFANLSLPVLSSDLAWRVDYLPTSVRLDVLLSADFNQDGVVDDRDYVVWRARGLSQADYLNFRSHYGMSVTLPSGASAFGSSNAVPEPTSLILLGIVAVFASLRRTQPAA